jgi:pimeloyl-ACP methyl ester carboxylesterase
MTPPVLKPLVEGPADGAPLFFVQGWPDDHSLWDEQVARLRDRYRCVRIDLPNHEGAVYRRWGYSHEEMVEGLANCVRAFSPAQPITLIGHDWGAYWAYWLHHRYPDLVSRIVGLDVAPDIKPNAREVLLIIVYQWWLLAAFVFGGRVGDWMTRRMARVMGVPKPESALRSSMNYPYLYAWRDIVTGRIGKIFEGYSPQVPVLYVYGAKKPGQFHTQRWLESIRSRPANKVVALEGTGHWVTLDPKLSGLMRDWLDATPKSDNSAEVVDPRALLRH